MTITANSRSIVIGDIHGCGLALRTLLDAVAPQTEDLVIPLGDYVDRGPDSQGVIEQLLQLERSCRLVPLRGNHEIMLLSALAEPVEAEFWLDCGGQATVDSYGGDLQEIPPAHVAFLERCRGFLELAQFFCVHANYMEHLPLEKQPEYVLYWEHLHAHLPGPHVSGKTAVVGHTPQRNGHIFSCDHLICIDTYCYGGGWLTALDLETRHVWQANEQGQLREVPAGDD
jgi:serine/threonine protein phosphatase 1